MLLYNETLTKDQTLEDFVDCLIKHGDQQDLKHFETTSKIFFYDDDNDLITESIKFNQFIYYTLYENIELNKYYANPQDSKNTKDEKFKSYEIYKMGDLVTYKKDIIEKMFYPEKSKRLCSIL